MHPRFRVVTLLPSFGTALVIAMFLMFVAFGTLDYVPLVENAESLAYGGVLVTGITLLLIPSLTMILEDFGNLRKRLFNKDG